MSLLTVDVPATHSGAPITIVGEKPGKDEACWRICPKCSHGDLDLKCRTCDLPTIPRPEGFVGRSGRALTQMAAAAGITAFNKSNVVKCADGGTTSDEFKHYFYETVDVAQTTKSGRVSKLVKRIVRPTAILEIWIDRLRTELLEHQANVVVAAGNEALYALTGLQGIEKYRGSLLESSLIKGQKVIPLIHPAAIFYGQRWEYYYVGIADLRKALRESASASYRAPTYTSIFSPKWDDVLDFIGMVMQKGQRWCLDLETRAGWIACVGLSCGSNPSDISTLCIPIQTTKGPYWKPAEEAMFWKLLATLMRRNPNLVGQNIFGFDLDFLLDYGCEPSGIYMDTMSAFALCYPELPKALDFIVSLYGSLPYYKFEAKTWSSTIPDEQLWTYNSKDTFSTLEISWECEKNLREANLWDLYNDYILPVHWMALELQKRRIPVSVDNRDEAKKIVLEELNRIKVDCQAMLKRYEPELIKATSIKHKKVSKDITQEILGKPITAETFNVGSPQHMQALVFGAMKLPARHKRGSKALTTEEEALMDLIAYYPEKTEDLKLLMYEKHLRKAIDYVTYNLDENGYLAFQISFPGTKSFRFSMSASPRGRGFNAQTPPRWSRFQYVPPNGRVFLSRDLSQVEARVVAVLSMCRGQLNQFADPAWSIHKDLGKAIYGSVPLKDTAQYTAAKSAVHGGNYREGPLKMARSSGVPFKDTKLAADGYHRRYPEIKLWHDVVWQTVLKKGQLKNPFGYRRVFLRACGHLALQGILDDHDWNDAVSSIPQSIPPFIINQAIVRCMQALPWVWFHHQGHDSFLASVPIGRVIEADTFMEQALRIEIPFDNGLKLVVPSEAQVGYTWGEMMPLVGVEPSEEQWKRWVMEESAVGRGRSSKSILMGINGIL